MYREIKARRERIQNAAASLSKAEEELNKKTLLYWIWSEFRLSGSVLSKKETERLMNGELVEGASLQEHSRAVFCQDLFRKMRDFMEMQTELDLKTLKLLYGCSIGDGQIEYRSNNPVLPHLDHTPPHFNEVEEEMRKLFVWIRSGSAPENVIERAAILHNGIAAIYPFGEDSFSVARIAVQYLLMQNAFPPVLWDLKEQEYFDMLRPYMKKKDILPCYLFLERSVFNQQEFLLQQIEER